MDTKALRQKILDLAIRGKLVPQDPNDEPASVLLERICAEKQQMVKDGKLKAKDIKNDTVIFKGEDNLHYEKFADGTVKCIEEEIPFELPEGWEWERLGNISNIARGGSPRPIESYITDDKSGINWIKIGDTEKDGKYIYTTKEKIKKEGLSKSRYVESDDFLLTNSMSFGRPYILKTNGCIHDGWLVIGNIKNVFNQDYLYYALSSNFMYQTLSLLAAGSTVKNLKSDTVKSVLFPIPPMKEQQEIANAVNRFMEYVVSIEKDKTTLLETIQSTKSKILDLAIRGKLVPQDSNDEPASVLLERIRAEKEELIKLGKIKRDKKESVIFKGEDNSYYEKVGSEVRCIDEELPFEIPDNWEWVRLWSLFSHNTGKALNSKSQVGSPYKYITTSNLYWNRFELGNLKQMLFSESELEKCTVRKGDLLVCEGGDIGRSAIWNYDEEIRIQNHIHRLRPYTDLNVNFYYYTMYLYKVTDRINGKGIGIQGLSSNQLHTLPLPLPPLSEQQRITAKIKALFDILDSIENALIE